MCRALACTASFLSDGGCEAGALLEAACGLQVDLVTTGQRKILCGKQAGARAEAQLVKVVKWQAAARRGRPAERRVTTDMHTTTRVDTQGTHVNVLTCACMFRLAHVRTSTQPWRSAGGERDPRGAAFHLHI